MTTVKEKTLVRLHELGQSIWLDTISRSLIRGGKLKELIEEDGLCGVTSNPSIFQKAIAESDDYDQDIRRLIQQGMRAEQVYEVLAVQDIQEAADLFRQVYDRNEGRDGFVSLEVSPHLARDMQGSIEEARRLWKKVDRPNVLIKIPGTEQGLPAIRQCLTEGININITLLFGLPQYLRVAKAYIEAVETRLAEGRPVQRLASVASFFLSRIDVLADPMLEKLIQQGSTLAESLRGQVAVCSAKIAYQMYKELFGSDKFRRLAGQGARTQRVLWASTSTKTPGYSDVMYVEPLIGPDTVNTMPMATVDAYRDHGQPEVRLEDGADRASAMLSHLSDLGIDLNSVTAKLEEEGIEKFAKPYDSLMETLRGKGAK